MKAEQEGKQLEKVIEDNRKRLQHEIEQIETELSYVHGQIREINNSKSSTTEGLKHFSAQLEALYIGTSWDESPTLCVARFMVMLLFVFIEVIPTFFKMMVSAGPYDDMLNAEMYRIKVLSEQKISDVNDEVNTAVQISTESNKNKLEAELAANRQLLEKLSAAQSELLCRAIELWKAEEMKKVEANPSEYITVNTQQPS